MAGTTITHSTLSLTQGKNESFKEFKVAYAVGTLYQNHQICTPLKWWIYFCAQCNEAQVAVLSVGCYWLTQQIESGQVFIMGTNMKDLEMQSAIMIHVQGFLSQIEVSFTCQSRFSKWQVKCPDNWQLNQSEKVERSQSRELSLLATKCKGHVHFNNCIAGMEGTVRENQ